MNLQLVYPRAIMALGLPVYFKMKICYTKKQNKTKGQETKKGKFSSARVEPRTSALSIAPRQLQSTPDNSNLQGKSKIVRVIGSSKTLAGSKEKTDFTAQ